MALQAESYPAAPSPIPQAKFTPELTASTRRRERAWNSLPIVLSLLIVSTLGWAPFVAPWVLASALVAFFGYWAVRSYATVAACAVGMFHLRRWQRINWQAKYCAWLPSHPETKAWDWPRHMVIIPNYNELEDALVRALDSLSAQPNAAQLVIVLGMEQREAGARAKAARLLMRYRNRFDDMFATYHPEGLPNETPGKGSNEAWAAREAYIRLIEDGRGDIDRYTVTSCDADSVFHPREFEALNYLFLTDGKRYRTFWQPCIFNSNNIWEIPAPLRVPDGLLGINRLSNLLVPGSVKFPTSCYSLSWRMLHEVDYWDEEVIPEDWHLYLKCCYALGDDVHVEPLFLPLGNDCVLAASYWKTLRAHYRQTVRHAWGASDIPYAWRAARDSRSPLSRRRKVALAGAVTKVHVLWLAQWYLITLGAHVPLLLARYFGAPMPHWWLARDIQLPGPVWHFGALIHGNVAGVITNGVTLTVATALIYVCIVPFIALIVLEYRMRGPRPAHVSTPAAIAQFGIWPLMAVITFFFASLPALHAQWKLARGHNLVYRVAEKGRRYPVPVSVSVSVAPRPEAVVETVGAVGGGS